MDHDSSMGITRSINLKIIIRNDFKHKEYGSMAEEQWKNEIKIGAKRGEILDRNGAQLAVSANVYRVDLDLKTLREDTFTKDDTDDTKRKA